MDTFTGFGQGKFSGARGAPCWLCDPLQLKVIPVGVLNVKYGHLGGNYCGIIIKLTFAAFFDPYLCEKF
jgi:hypothetical protein